MVKLTEEQLKALELDEKIEVLWSPMKEKYSAGGHFLELDSISSPGLALLHYKVTSEPYGSSMVRETGREFQHATILGCLGKSEASHYCLGSLNEFKDAYFDKSTTAIPIQFFKEK